MGYYAMSRRRRAAILGAVVLLAGAVVWLDGSGVTARLARPAKSEEAQKGRDFRKYHGKKFSVAKVVDGDTVDIDVPDTNRPHTRIRLWGVDTPETKSPGIGVMYFGPEAAEFTTKSALGKKVTVYLDEGNRSRGKYGRLLAYIQLPDETILNEVLLIEGYAYADLRFRHSFYHKYKQLEAAARSQKKGLWEGITAEQLPEWRRKRKGF